MSKKTRKEKSSKIYNPWGKDVDVLVTPEGKLVEKGTPEFKKLLKQSKKKKYQL